MGGIRHEEVVGIDERDLRGREQVAPFSARVDVVIVGSGAGGAVLARELARDGRSVLVLEEGGHYSPAEYGAMTPSNSFRRLARESGMSVALGIGDTPLSPLVSMLGLPAASEIDVLSDSNADSYWERSDQFDMALDMTAGRRSLAALGEVIAAEGEHRVVYNGHLDLSR